MVKINTVYTRFQTKIFCYDEKLAKSKKLDLCCNKKNISISHLAQKNEQNFELF